MNFADLETMWRSPHNRPSAAELEKQKMHFVAELRRLVSARKVERQAVRTAAERCTDRFEAHVSDGAAGGDCLLRIDFRRPLNVEVQLEVGTLQRRARERLVGAPIDVHLRLVHRHELVVEPDDCTAELRCADRAERTVEVHLERRHGNEVHGRHADRRRDRLPRFKRSCEALKGQLRVLTDRAAQLERVD